MTSTAQRSDFLGVDEDMEIYSEAGRGQESDIEIFDLEDDVATNVGDDEMVDDNQNEQKDEVMDEEFGREDTVDMDDEIVFDEDVEITEVAEMSTQDPPVIEVSGAQDQPDQETQAAPPDAQGAPLDEETDQIRAPVEVEEVSETSTAEPQEAGDQGTAQTLLEDQPAPVDDAPETSIENVANQVALSQHESSAEKTLDQQATAEDQSFEPKAETDGEAATHAAIPHDITVFYKRNNMCLFAPSDPEDPRIYLLHDLSLFHSPISDLFPACRNVLADSIDETDELHFEIPDLRLRLSEKTTRKPAASLSNILDVYLALSYNDSSDDPGPLCLTLHVVPEFQARLDSLHDLASEGQGFTSIIEPDESSDEDEWAEEELNSNTEADEPRNDSTKGIADSANPTEAIEGAREQESEQALGHATGPSIQDSSISTNESANVETVKPEGNGEERHGNDYVEDDNASAAAATEPVDPEVKSADQDASDTSATAQEEHDSPVDMARSSEKVDGEDKDDTAQETTAEEAQDEEAHAHGDDFDLDLGTGHEEDSSWHDEVILAKGDKQGETSTAETTEEAGHTVLTADHSTSNADAPEPAQGSAGALEESDATDLPQAAEPDKQFNDDAQEAERQVLDPETKPTDVVDSAAPDEQPSQKNLVLEEESAEQEGRLPDDDDIINFSEDDEAGETVSPSISHKRSRSELGADNDTGQDGSDLKKVKT